MQFSPYDNHTNETVYIAVVLTIESDTIPIALVCSN